MLSELGATDYLGYPGRTGPSLGSRSITCLLNFETRERIVVKAGVDDPEPTLPSAINLWLGADWMEREVFDMYGIRFEGHPDLRRILMPEEFAAHPLRKDYPVARAGRAAQLPEAHAQRVLIRFFDQDRASRGLSEPPSEARVPCRPTCSTSPSSTRPRVEREYHWTLNFGPQHPATHTTLRLVLELDGERIVKATPDIGYLHSGFEKLGEHLNFNQYVTIVDRKNYISPPYNEVAWHHAVEKLLDIELTERCQYIRVIIGELSRISDHLLCCGAAALDLGGFTAFLYAFNQRELIYDVYEEMSGYRFHPGYTRVGGVLYDFNEKVLDRTREGAGELA